MRPDGVVGVLKNSSLAFVRELVGADPVAVFRWAILRAFFRAHFAFQEAGRAHRHGRGERKNIIILFSVIHPRTDLEKEHFWSCLIRGKRIFQVLDWESTFRFSKIKIADPICWKDNFKKYQIWYMGSFLCRLLWIYRRIFEI